MELYEKKKRDYFDNARMDLVGIIPDGMQKILEIGAGTGSTLRALKAQDPSRYVSGIELVNLHDGAAPDEIDQFQYGDLEKQEFDLEENFFDLLLIGDVLEHLVNPDKILQNFAKYLKPNGLVVASIPNIRHISLIKRVVIGGDFKYDKSGLFDETHVKFFCKKNMIELFENANFSVQKMYSNLDLRNPNFKMRLIRKMAFNQLDEFLTLQYFIIAQKNEGSSLSN